MNKSYRTVLALAAGLLLTGLFAGAVPAGFNVQGRLTDSKGVNRNGGYSVKFTIYDALTGGNPFWTETFPSVNVINGNFQVVLGNVPGQPSLVSVFSGGDTRFMEVQVLSGPGVSAPETPLVPRQQLVSVPFAMSAETADSATALSSSGTVVMGTQGMERMRIDSNGNVGVGTSLPAYRLDVAGDVNITGTLRRNGAPVGGLATGSLGFGGLYYTGGSPTGGCLSANPATNACSCPAGFNDSSYYVYQAGGLNCGWSAGYTVLVPCYGQYVYIHQCWAQ